MMLVGASATSVMDRDYETRGVLGQGSFGAVTRVRRRRDGVDLACKSVTYVGLDESHKQQLVAEVNIMRDLRHRHVVKYVDHVVDRPNGTLHIIMELCQGGDLAQVIRARRRSRRGVDEGDAWRLVGQILDALRDCHGGVCGAAVLHRDLKPANVLFDGSGSVKLADFGLAKALKDRAALARTALGTPLYMAPEVVRMEPYGSAADVWSVGCIAFELAALAPPFVAPSLDVLERLIVKGARTTALPAAYSRDFALLVDAMLDPKAQNRPSAAELLQRYPRLQSRPCVAEAAPGPRGPTGRTALPSEAALLAAREAECTKKEAELEAIERALRRREAALGRREATLAQLDANVPPPARPPAKKMRH